MAASQVRIAVRPRRLLVGRLLARLGRTRRRAKDFDGTFLNGAYLSLRRFRHVPRGKITSLLVKFGAASIAINRDVVRAAVVVRE